MQGGAAYIYNGGHADFTGCALYGNTATGSVRARFEPSGAPLNYDTLRFFRTQGVGVRISNLLEPSSSAPLERFTTDCIILHAGRWGRCLWICQLRRMQLV